MKRLIAAICWFGLVGQATAEPPPFAPEFLEDAELNDVFFLNPDHGWAVGDRGVIWRTDDGGRQWRMSVAPVACRLESVHFTDDRQGWIVGGWPQPYTHRGAGVLLHTTDGGQRWKVVPQLNLPYLKRVRFFDHRRGWAAGKTSPLYPAGVFRTEDGGRSWAAAGGLGDSWSDADSSDGRNGAAVGEETAAALRGGVLQAGKKPGLQGRRIECVRLAHPWPAPTAPANLVRPAWLVGEGGLVLLSIDGGKNWNSPNRPPPMETLREFDFQALAVLGENCWIAGSPGTKVLHTANAGKSWTYLSTGQNAPIRALTFLDAKRGWAVGGWGTILATRDGGGTWRVQRRGGTRAAYVGFYSRPENAPWELIARLSGNEGYFGALSILHRLEDEPPLQQERTRAALSMLGGGSMEAAWSFPIPPSDWRWSADRLDEHLRNEQQRSGGPPLEEYLVRKIRQWRPDVLFTEAASANGENPAGRLVNQYVLRAVEKAGDPLFYPRQLEIAGLEPWRVSKVFANVNSQERGSMELATGQLAPRLGRSLAEHARLARALLRKEPAPTPPKLGFRLLINRLPEEQGRRDFFSGTAISPQGDARRLLEAPSPAAMRELTRVVQKQRMIEQLLQKVTRQTTPDGSWLSQVDTMLRHLNARSGAAVLHELAHRFRELGRRRESAQLQELLIKRFPNSPLGEPAKLWLMRYYASGEEAVRNRAQYAHAETAGAEPTIEGGLKLQRMQQRRKVKGGLFADKERAQKATAYAQLVQLSAPDVFASPATQFTLAAVERTLEWEQAGGYYRRQGLPGFWARQAQGELWLQKPTGEAPVPVWRCLRTEKKPYLDGKLEEPFWKSPSMVVIAGGPTPAQSVLAYDSEFLYLAAVCPKPPGASYPLAQGTRQRDADLSGRDRIIWRLDIDRDYSTYYELAIDHRGWARDLCVGDVHWNPSWHIASQDHPGHWSVEAAIPWDALVDQPPTAGQAWAISARRATPGVGAWNWGGLKEPHRGLLRFE